MPIRLSPQTGLLLPATLAIALAAWPAAAQQSTPTPPPPTPNQPTSDAAGKLRGINPPPFPMAADKLPVIVSSEATWHDLPFPIIFGCPSVQL